MLKILALTRIKTAVNQNTDDNDSESWGYFRFPKMPAQKHKQFMDSGNMTHAPLSSAPAMAVDSWHLDVDRLVIVHYVRKRKINLAPIDSRQKLMLLGDLIEKQPTLQDCAELYLAINNACFAVFGMSLFSLLVNGPEHINWGPINDM